MTLTKIVLLATLHQMHSQIPSYGFKELSEVVRSLRPAALVVELQQSEISNFPQKPIEGSKVEYARSILPTAQALKVPVYPLEPSGGTRDKILALYEES